ncbi:MAG TPA: glycosyltransferase family 87 protein, partial [Anaerolineae bacterium]|nr:glycosyltransferase family 87 protein [Anaerolineae bacterium]
MIVKPSRLTVLTCVGLIGVYAGWLGYIIVKDRPIDFYVYYIAAEDLARGGDPYTISDTEWNSLAAQLNITNYTSPYRYPPQSAVLLTFFRPLGPRGAMIVWVIADAAAMILGAWILGKALGGGWWLPLSLSSLLIFIPPLATLLAGQVNGFIFLCLAIAFAAIKDHRAGRMGISLAIGAALKVIPVALIFYSFWRRQWKAGLIGLGALAALTLICLPIANSSVLTSYARSAVALGSPSELTSTPTNQTITAVLQRLSPLDLAAATSMGRWLSLLVIVITIGVCWPIGPTDLLMPVEFGLIVAALQLIPPFTWYHQLVLLLVP